MPTHLSLVDHRAALVRSGNALRTAAATAGLDAKVPTCPAWDVTRLVTHQGMVHRWAAANLRGETDHDTSASQAEAKAAPDLLEWYSDGLAALVETIEAAADDTKAMVFLKDAPPPRRFWARRQAHETTIHSADAVSAVLGRWPTASDMDLDPAAGGRRDRRAADGLHHARSGQAALRRPVQPSRESGRHPSLVDGTDRRRARSSPRQATRVRPTSCSPALLPSST